ncbi:MAG: beta-propeller domain-containing protein [Methanomassiliicoccales archaeon]|nr:MAG: beta-propeller domain-containing protein [Methanomassiliicoccales archaeon]
MKLTKRMRLTTIILSTALFVNLIMGYVNEGNFESEQGETIDEPDDSFYQDYFVIKSENGRLLLLPKENINDVEVESPKVSLTRSSDSPFIENGDTNIVDKFSSLEELRSYVENHTAESDYYRPYTGGSGKVTEGSALGYSTTNVQVMGVDEGDIVKTDGEFAYIVSKDKCSVFIADVNPAGEAEIVSTVKSVGSIREIYVKGDTLVVLGQRTVFQIDPSPDSLESQYCSVHYKGKKVKFDVGKFYYLSYIYYQATFIDIFDISDRGDPSLMDSHVIKGYPIASRMIGNFMYVITSNSISRNFEEYDLPVPAFEIYYLRYSNDPTYLNHYLQLTTILSIDITDPSTIVDLRVLLMSSSSNIYVSLTNIYITYREYSLLNNNRITSIHRITIDCGEILYKAYGEIEGTLLSRFSMDEYEGFFRVAASIWFSSSHGVYVLDMDLKIVGRLEGIAPDEVMYSARFMGDRLYLVTFRRVDPFFVIDLSDPLRPELLGELVIPGWSDYLHPYDENHIIGLGKEVAPNGWTEGVKLSLFDVINVENPKEMSKYVIGDRYTSTIAADEPHAFLFNVKKNLLVIPVRYNFTVTSAYVFDISLENGFELRGTVGHPSDADNQYEYDWYDYDIEIKRSFYIDDTLYTLSNNYLQMNDLNDLHEINLIELPNEQGSSSGVQVMCLYLEPFIR